MKQKNKLHITFLDFDDIANPLLGAGQARATVEVGKRLVKRGHSVTVIASRFPGYRDRTENGLQYKHIGIGTKNIRLNNFMYILALPFTVMKLKSDIVVECFTAPISTLFSPWFTKIPVVALPSSFEADRFTKLYHFPFNKIERFGLRFYKYYLPLSAYFDKKMKKINKNVISRIIPEGVGEEFFEIKRDKPAFILFLGRLDMGQKGVDLLLKAYKKVEETIGYPLVIAGNGPDEDKIRAMIKELQLEKSVALLGPTYGVKKARVLSHALFVAFTSRHETFSCFALEALAAGLPLAAFDIPGLTWTSDDVVFKAKAFSVNQYAKLLTTTAKRATNKTLSANARKFAKQFTWEKVVNDFESFFTEVLAREESLRQEKHVERRMAYVL